MISHAVRRFLLKHFQLIPVSTVKIVLFDKNGEIMYQCTLPNTFKQISLGLRHSPFDYIEERVDVPKEYTGLA